MRFVITHPPKDSSYYAFTIPNWTSNVLYYHVTVPTTKTNEIVIIIKAFIHKHIGQRFVAKRAFPKFEFSSTHLYCFAESVIFVLANKTMSY